MDIVYYKLTPSDMTVSPRPGADPEPLEDYIETGRPTVPVTIVDVEDDPFHGLTVCIYYREA